MRKTRKQVEKYANAVVREYQEKLLLHHIKFDIKYCDTTEYLVCNIIMKLTGRD